MFDVVGLGELLIDFTPAGLSAAGNNLFERNPGGGPANLLAAVSKLGGSGAFIGKVGNDQFGHYLKSVMVEKGIETRGLKFSDKVNTTLAFVHLDDNGDRSFSFYRKPGADIELTVEDLDYSLIDECNVFHFGSLSMTNEPSKSATLKAVQYAREKGKIISYDPNWRPPLWESDAAAKSGMDIGFKYADILKISELELEFLTGEKNLELGSKIFFDRGITLIIVTLGPKGCYYRYNGGTGYLNTYDTKVVDTTGAGDAFLGGLLYRISRLGTDINKVDKVIMEDILDFSNAVGALCASRRGGIPAMPSIAEVSECRRNIKKLLRQC